MRKGRTVSSNTPESEPTKLVFRIPGPEERGFLRRQREAAHHLDAVRTQASVTTIDSMIDFLATFVEEPSDSATVHALLMDMSRSDYNRLLTAVMGGKGGFLP